MPCNSQFEIHGFYVTSTLFYQISLCVWRRWEIYCWMALTQPPLSALHTSASHYPPSLFSYHLSSLPLRPLSAPPPLAEEEGGVAAERCICSQSRLTRAEVSSWSSLCISYKDIMSTSKKGHLSVFRVARLFCHEYQETSSPCCDSCCMSQHKKSLLCDLVHINLWFLRQALS